MEMLMSSPPGGTEKNSKKSAAGRKGTYTPEEFLAVGKRMSVQIARLRGLAKAMEEAELQPIEVDGSNSMLRGLDRVDDFLGHAERVIRRASAKKK